jgi:hypothetical protein
MTVFGRAPHKLAALKVFFTIILLFPPRFDPAYAA